MTIIAVKVSENIDIYRFSFSEGSHRPPPDSSEGVFLFASGLFLRELTFDQIKSN